MDIKTPAGLPSLRSGLRLRTILLLASAIALAITLFALGAVMSREALQSIEKEEGNKLSAEAKYFAELLDLTIGQQLTDLRSKAAVLPQLGLHHAPQRLELWLTAIQQNFSDYTWVGFADPQGTVISATSGLLKGKSVAAREWFTQGKGQPVTVDLHPALLLEPSLPGRAGNPWRFIDLAAPVRDPQGRLIGVLGAHLSWDWLISHHQRFSDSLARNRHADIVVAGVDGLARLTSPTSRMHTLIELESFKRAAAGESGWIRERWPEGQHFVVGYTRNPGYGDHHQLGWVTLVRLPQEHIHELASPALWTVWTSIGIANAVLITAVLLILKLAIQPIEKFASQAQQIAAQGGRMHATARMSKELRLLAQATNEMIDALKAREASEQAKMRFFADASHEMRNPMQGAMGYARLLQSRAHTQEDKQDIEQLIECIIAATEVSNDTLDISANEAGQLRLHPAPCRLREAITSSIAILESRAIAKGLAITQQIDLNDGLVVMADRKRLRQVMLNLLSNSIKFTDKGSIAVRAWVLPDASPGPSRATAARHPAEPMLRIGIEVADTGIGMSSDEQTRLFGRWQQSINDASAHHVGYGLGLDVTLAIINAMGGQLQVTSNPEAGTVIHIELALQLAHPSPDPATAAAHDALPRSAKTVDASPAAPLRILVVDDLDANREVLRRWLQMHGHHVSEAPTGTLALARAQDTIFDVILMDIDLPDIGGRDAAIAIRLSGSASSDALICALSGHGFKADVQASMQAGMDRHLIKPLDFDELETLLQEAYLRAGRKT